MIDVLFFSILKRYRFYQKVSNRESIEKRGEREMKNDNKIIIGIIILIIGVIGNKLILCLPITSEYGDVIVSFPNWIMRFLLFIFTIFVIFGVVSSLLNYLDLKK